METRPHRLSHDQLSMHEHASHHRWLHGFALATTAAALLPIVVGALVTTLGAGMAFADWPSSDGHHLLLYPWLQSAGDKFAEHGHRLAGALIGLVAIGLAACAWGGKTRPVERLLATGVLGAVILQGILGGQRVLLNDPRLALVHSAFGACVFCLMGATAVVSSPAWTDARLRSDDCCRISPLLVALGLATPMVVFVQYVAGGLVRHLGSGLFEHLGLAAVVAVLVISAAGAALQSGQKWLRVPAWTLLLLVCGQVLLGLAAWVVKFGFPPAGYVAPAGSLAQTLIRTGHTVVGMLLLMNSVVLALRACRLTAAALGSTRTARRGLGVQRGEPSTGGSVVSPEGGLP